MGPIAESISEPTKFHKSWETIDWVFPCRQTGVRIGVSVTFLSISMPSSVVFSSGTIIIRTICDRNYYPTCVSISFFVWKDKIAFELFIVAVHFLK